MALTEKYYIEKLSDGTTLNTDGTWEAFTPNTSARSFSSRSLAFDHVDTLSNDEYRIYSRIVKS